MTVQDIVNEAVARIRAIPEKLSGDDSALTDLWEEIKEQVQHEESFYWSLYVQTMQDIIERIVVKLSREDRLAIADELCAPPEDTVEICELLYWKLIHEATFEEIGCAPFDFKYFRYSLGDMTVYAEIIKRTGLYSCEVMAYSAAAPTGDFGEVGTNIIDSRMSAADFERARLLGWPEQWKNDIE